jgi:HemY protein
MIRRVLAALLLILLGALIVRSFYEDNGYVLLHYRPYTIETSLTFFLFSVVVILLGLFVLWRLLRFALGLPARVRETMRQARNRRARESLVRGLLRMTEGRWQQAETEILRQAPLHDASVVNYLFAARVAQRLGTIERRDDHLRKAYGAKPASEIAVLLTQAELQMEQGQDTQALASLMRVHELDKEQGRARELLVGLYEKLQDWPALYALLEEIEKDGLIQDERWEALAVRCQQQLLARAAGNGAPALHEAWEALPRRLRRHPRLIEAQARLLAKAGLQVEATSLCVDALGRSWDADLGLLFSDLQPEDALTQLTAVEGWLKLYGEEPSLLRVAGRLCLRNRLWGRARSYLEQSLQNLPRADTYLDLGQLFEEIKDPAAAQAAYRKGLELASAVPAAVPVDSKARKAS